MADFTELARILRQSGTGSGRSTVTSTGGYTNTDMMTEALLRQRQQQLEQQAAITRGNASQQGDIQARLAEQRGNLQRSLASQQGDIQGRLQGDRLKAQYDLQTQANIGATNRDVLGYQNQLKAQRERIAGTSALSGQEAEQKKKQGLTNAALALAAFRGTSTKLKNVDFQGAKKSLGI